MIINNKIRCILIVVCVLIIAIYPKNNSISIVNELKDGTAQNFASAYDKRITLMEGAKPNEIIEVDPLPDSRILKFGDITNDITNWKNAGWYYYYGYKMVVKNK